MYFLLNLPESKGCHLQSLNSEIFPRGLSQKFMPTQLVALFAGLRFRTCSARYAVVNYKEVHSWMTQLTTVSCAYAWVLIIIAVLNCINCSKNIYNMIIFDRMCTSKRRIKFAIAPTSSPWSSYDCNYVKRCVNLALHLWKWYLKSLITSSYQYSYNLFCHCSIRIAHAQWMYLWT